MLHRKRKDRWSAHVVLEHIRELSLGTSAQFLYIDRCCLDEYDTEESVISHGEELLSSPRSVPKEDKGAKTEPNSSQTNLSHGVEVTTSDHGRSFISPPYNVHNRSGAYGSYTQQYSSEYHTPPIRVIVERSNTAGSGNTSIPWAFASQDILRAVLRELDYEYRLDNAVS